LTPSIRGWGDVGVVGAVGGHRGADGGSVQGGGDYRLSRQWVHELVRRFDADGQGGLEARSRRPRSSPSRIPLRVEDEIVALRTALADQGLDAGAHTIAHHVHEIHGRAPSPSTIWRILRRRGFITPQPQKRPRSSFVRFEAEMPNERWQADVTHWALAEGTHVEILNVIDDHSRFLLACDARTIIRAAAVVEVFHRVAVAKGFPAEVLTDNGAVFTGAPRGGRSALEVSSPRSGSATCAPGRTTPRRVARWSGCTKP
jgi:hypothetical protein